MAYLVAAVAVLALLCVGNLALTLALARRMRASAPEQRPLRMRTSAPEQRPLRMLDAGRRIGSFRATDAGGALIDDGQVAGLVAFLSPSCPPCQAELPRIQEVATRMGGPRRVLAVVDDDHEDPELVAAMVAALRTVARVVVAHTGDPLTRAFGVDAYPALFLVEDGIVVGAGHSVDQLPATATIS